MKKYFALFFAIMIICMKSFAADFSAVCSSGQTLYYNIIDDVNHKVEITYPGSSLGSYSGYTKPTGTIVFPSTVLHNGIPYSVVGIGERAFYACGGITDFTLSSSILTVGESACENCESLVSITWNNVVQTIEKNSFRGCNLSIISLPISVERIGFFAFNGNPITSVSIANPEIVLGNIGLEFTPWYNSHPNNSFIYIGTILYDYKGNLPANSTVTIEEGTTSIAGGVFELDNLFSVYMPNSVRVIGDYAFYKCQITSFSISSNLKWIGARAFEECGGFTTLTLPFSLEYIGGNAFENCDALTTVHYNAQMADVGGSVFNGCDNLVTLNIGGGVKRIPQHLFSGCNAVTSVTIPESVEYIGKRAFGSCANLHTIYYNAINCNTDANSYSQAVFDGSNSISAVSIGNSVHIIPRYLFYHTNITSLTIPESVIRIDPYAFANSYLLSSLCFNASCCNSEASSSNGPFSGCGALTSISFGNNVQRVPDGLFAQAITAPSEALSFPNSLTYIGRYAFYGCTGVTGTLTFPAGVTKINDSSFQGCTGLTNIIIPNTVTVLDTHAFSGCSGVTQTTIGTAVDTIRSNAFAFCQNLRVVNWNAINCRSTDAQSSVFNGGVTSFNIGSSVQGLPDNLIKNSVNMNLSSVVFPNTLQRIGAWNFSSCGSGIVHFPSSLTNIGYGAFNGCWGISRVQCDAVVPPIFEPDEYGTYLALASPGTPLYVPCESISSYQSTQGWSHFNNVLGTGDCNYNVNLVANNPGMGAVSGAGTYAQGTSVTITATPYSGYKFEHWSDGDTHRQRTIIVNEDITLIAYFALITTSIEDNGLDDLQIYSYKKEIVIEGANERTISIFSVDGCQIAMIEKANHQTIIRAPSTGIYIVKVGEQTVRKVMIQ